MFPRACLPVGLFARTALPSAHPGVLRTNENGCQGSGREERVQLAWTDWHGGVRALYGDGCIWLQCSAAGCNESADHSVGALALGRCTHLSTQTLQHPPVCTHVCVYSHTTCGVAARLAFNELFLDSLDFHFVRCSYLCLCAPGDGIGDCSRRVVYRPVPTVSWCRWRASIRPAPILNQGAAGRLVVDIHGIFQMYFS
jgi:hypothetical protein